MTAAPLDALGLRPELFHRFGSPAALGAAYRAGDGAVLLCWPPRERRVTGTYMTADFPHFTGGAPEEHALEAAFLTSEDVERAAATWRRPDPAFDDRQIQANREARLREVRAVAADRARTRSALLRQLRVEGPPPGSACVATRLRSTLRCPLLRFEGGGGWWGCKSAATAGAQPWEWREGGRIIILRILALGLSDEQLREVAHLDEVEALEAELRRRGWAA